MPLSNARTDAAPLAPEDTHIPTAEGPRALAVNTVPWRSRPEDEKREVKRAIRKMLAERPEMACEEIAEACGVRVRLVYSIQGAIARRRGTLTDTSQLVSETERLRRLLRKSLPLEDRARLWSEIANSKNPQAAQRALERIDEYLGVGKESADALPLFILPSDAAISVFIDRLPVTGVSTAEKVVDSPILKPTT